MNKTREFRMSERADAEICNRCRPRRRGRRRPSVRPSAHDVATDAHGIRARASVVKPSRGRERERRRRRALDRTNEVRRADSVIILSDRFRAGFFKASERASERDGGGDDDDARERRRERDGVRRGESRTRTGSGVGGLIETSDTLEAK